MFPPCSMPSLPTIYSLSWRKCLEPPGHSAEAQACRQGTQRPHAEGRCAALAMPRRAVGRLKRAPAAGALQRSPWSAVGLPLGPARAQPSPAAIATGRIGTAMA